MSKIKKILAVIPARKDSKGIPQKNKVVLGGVPLIFHTITKVKSIPIITDVCITTDDEEIISYSNYLNITAIKRNPELCKDNVPLAPVVSNAVKIMEKTRHYRYDIVILIQPTSPTIKKTTIQSALEAMVKDNNYDTYLTAVKIQHLFWLEKGGQYYQYHKKRVNRQDLDPIYMETGAFFIVKRENITDENIIGKNVNIIEVSKEEALDIDEPLDLGYASVINNQKKILFCVVGSKLSGLGHVFRVLTLSRWLSKYHIEFATTIQNDIARELITSNNYILHELADWSEITDLISKYQPDVIINDVLDTTKEFMNELINSKHENDYRIINFEDLGNGSNLADNVINALYETSLTTPNHSYGYKYVVLKDMFRFLPMKEITHVEKILVTYGGTDQNHITPKVATLLIKELSRIDRNYEISIVIGPGFSEALKREIHELCSSKILSNVKLTVKDSVKEMALEMFDRDLVITSNGRTVYEAISLGIPVIAFAQNEREESHLFSKFAPCVNYLGRYNKDKHEIFYNVLRNLLIHTEELVQQNKSAIEFGKEIREGIKRVLNIIEGDML